MPNTPDGGPAFPGFEHYIADREDSKGPVRIVTGQPYGGISVRDYFAGQALPTVCYPSMLSSCQTDEECSLEILNASVLAYRIADAMLAERAK